MKTLKKPAKKLVVKKATLKKLTVRSSIKAGRITVSNHSGGCC